MANSLLNCLKRVHDLSSDWQRICMWNLVKITINKNDRFLNFEKCCHQCFLSPGRSLNKINICK